MKNILLQLYKTGRPSVDPEKISNNTFKFYSDFDYEILPERNNLIKSGFYLKGVDFCISPTNIYNKYNSIPMGFSSNDASLDINIYCYNPKDKNNFHFAEIGKILQKRSCIFYLNIISSNYEENYIFDITK
jgi:hypothetical protein